MVLQTAVHEPAVRHAVVALATLHECFGSSTAKTIFVDSKFGSYQYCAAIKHLTSRTLASDGYSIAVALISCMLFASVEYLQGHTHAAFSHIKSGFKIINEEMGKGSQSAGRSLVPWEVLHSQFKILEVQLFEMEGLRRDFYAEETLFTKLSTFSSLQQFRDLEEAQRVLGEWYHNFCGFLGFTTMSERDAVVQSAFVSSFRTWSKMFQVLRNAYESGEKVMTESEKQAIFILEARAKLIGSAIHFDRGSLETWYDDNLPEFTALIEAAEIVVSTQPSDIARPTFSLAAGIVAALYVCATHCRDPTIRRRAIDLLYRCNRREGAWDSRLAAQVAETIMQIEETSAARLLKDSDPGKNITISLASHIPHKARVKQLGVDFHLGKHGILKLGHWRKNSQIPGGWEFYIIER